MPWLRNSPNEDDKEDVWSRLTELATFALVGFGFFSCKIGTGAYNRERKSTVLRQTTEDRDSSWDVGVRAPFGNRLAHASAALTCGGLSDTAVSEDTVMLSDCYPRSQEIYDVFAPNGKKYEARGKQPETLGQFLRCAKQHIILRCLLFGQEHREERTQAMLVLERLHESHPDLFALSIIVGAWEDMTYRYIAAVKEGTRKMVRTLPETVRKGEFRRNALTPMADGRSRWEYPTTFLMEHPTGYWQCIAVPRLEEKVSRSTWKAFLGAVPKRLAAGGGEENQAEIIPSDSRVPDSDYPAGQPLSETEQKACRNHRPKSLSDGKYLCWDFSSHAGCRSPGGICPRGKHEITKTAGLHTLIQMQLARRGGHLAGKKIQPRNVDGHVQALRLQLTSKDLDPPQWKPKWKK